MLPLIMQALANHRFLMSITCCCLSSRFLGVINTTAASTFAVVGSLHVLTSLPESFSL